MTKSETTIIDRVGAFTYAAGELRGAFASRPADIPADLRGKFVSTLETCEAQLYGFLAEAEREAERRRTIQ